MRNLLYNSDTNSARHAAGRAVASWNIDGEPELLTRLENITYQAGPRGHERIIRVTEDSHRTLTELEAELDGVRFLSQRGVRVAAPFTPGGGSAQLNSTGGHITDATRQSKPLKSRRDSRSGVRSRTTSSVRVLVEFNLGVAVAHSRFHPTCTASTAQSIPDRGKDGSSRTVSTRTSLGEAPPESPRLIWKAPPHVSDDVVHGMVTLNAKVRRT